MKKSFLLLALSIAVIAAEAQQRSGINPRTAVTLSARQRMMTMRLTIARLFILSGVQTEKFSKEYNNSATWFGECNKVMKKFSPNKSITKRVNFVSDRWEKYSVAEKALDTSAKSVQDFLTNSQLLYAVCNDQTTRLIQFAYDVNTQNSQQYREEELLSRHITYVSRIRAHCLNIVLNYLLNHNKYDAGAPLKITKAAEGIQATLATLSASAINNSDIDNAIAEAYQIWNDFKSNYFNPGTYKLKEVNAAPITISDAMTVFQAKLDEITFAYASLSGA
jgi:hypothetical protein